MNKRSNKLHTLYRTYRKTIAQVDCRMKDHIKVKSIAAEKVKDNHIVVPVHILGSYSYRISLEKINEIYGKARKKVISAPMNN